MADQQDELPAYHRAECNRYTNGFCGTARCMKRGGWKPGGTVSYEIATCESHETVLKLAELTSLREQQAQREQEAVIAALRKVRDAIVPGSIRGVDVYHVIDTLDVASRASRPEGT